MLPTGITRTKNDLPPIALEHARQVVRATSLHEEPDLLLQVLTRLWVLTLKRDVDQLVDKGGVDCRRPRTRREDATTRIGGHPGSDSR